jgi:hypothetical protein
VRLSLARSRTERRTHAMTAPKTKWRPASLPASTVPRSVSLAREGETAFPREVPAEALRPRSVPQVPSQEYCYSGSGSCGFRALPCGRLRFPGGIRPSPSCDIDIRFPIGRPLKRTSSVVLSRNLPPGGFRFRRTLEGKWVRLWLAPPPRASSFRLPGTFASIGFGPKTSAALRGAAAESVSPFPESRALRQASECQRFPSRAKRYLGESACG